MLLVGPTDVPTRAVLLGAGWVINVAVAEYVIHRRARKSARAPRPSGRSTAARLPS